MSDDLFYGRPLIKGKDSISFDVCEICQQKTANWLESKFENDAILVRFTCEECHNKGAEKRPDEAFFARPVSEDETVPETTRPAWMEEFIQDQSQSGSIATIGDAELEPDIPDPAERGDEYQAEEPEMVDEETTESISPQAEWSAAFVQEALFGPNPEEWLENQGAFKTDVLKLTLETLASFKTSQVSGVKLSAILCLAGLVRRDNSYKTQVIKELESFASDADESVSDFSKQTIDQLK